MESVRETELKDKSTRATGYTLLIDGSVLLGIYSLDPD
jgi:hypothetical protein